MRLTKFAALATLSALVAGCAVTPSGPLQFNPKKSRALNIAEAGGIYKGVKDAHLPKDTTGALTDSVIYNSMYAGMGFINPGPGLSNLQGFGLGILAGLFEPDSPGARNSFMAWMPTNMAITPEDAREKIQANFFDATKSVLDSYGIKYTFYYGRNINVRISNIDHVASFILDKSSCSNNDNYCKITMNAYIPVKTIAPAFVSGNESYFFSAAEDWKYNNIQIEIPKDFHISQIEIHKKISEQMPTWFYTYLSPNKTFDKDGQKLKFPILLEKGEPNLFVIRE